VTFQGAACTAVSFLSHITASLSEGSVPKMMTLSMGPVGRAHLRYEVASPHLITACATMTAVQALRMKALRMVGPTPQALSVAGP